MSPRSEGRRKPGRGGNPEHEAPDGERLKSFRRRIREHYRRHGRDLPWRKTTEPYRIVVSEIMLQQTQVERVLTKYPEFLAAFPDVASLARAPLRDVLRVWQGMGYNRRAVSLRKLAETIVERHGGRFPSAPEDLARLPGIGPATAASICAFAYNEPVVFIETNIRRVFIHHFFADAAGVSDAEIAPLVGATLDRRNPRDWYNALMDYGSMLKTAVPNPNRRSAHYTRQSRFEGSDRQLRGKILRLLQGRGRLSERRLSEELGADGERFRKIMKDLSSEGFLVKEKRSYRLA